MLKSSSPSLISLSIFQSVLLLFLMPLLLPVSLLHFSFSKFSQFHTSTDYNLCIFLLLSFQCECQMCILDLSVCISYFSCQKIISGRLCSKVLSVYIGKSHKILQFSNSRTFSGLCIYHFFALLKTIFHITSNAAF